MIVGVSRISIVTRSRVAINFVKAVCAPLIAPLRVNDYITLVLMLIMYCLFIKFMIAKFENLTLELFYLTYLLDSVNF